MQELLTRTSHEWLKHFPEVTVIDPDGWDRVNYEASMNERISYAEFLRRLSLSTIRRKFSVSEE